MKTPTVPELYDACTVLFGPDIDVSFEFLRYLQPTGVTAAFRQRAKETHPDRAVVIGKSPESLAMLFKDVRQAYEKLHAVIGNDAYFRGVEQIYSRNPPPSTPRSTGKRQSWWAEMSSGFHAGDFRQRPQNFQKRQSNNRQSDKPRSARQGEGYIPHTTLLFGQYLYYSGHIDWNALISSIVWQRSQRPLVGKLAVNWRLITEDQVREILFNRRVGEKFGDCAVRLGKITDPHLKILLWRQTHLQKPIGRYFVEKGMLSSQKIEQLADEVKQHNAQALYRQRNKVAI